MKYLSFKKDHVTISDVLEKHLGGISLEPRTGSIIVGVLSDNAMLIDYVPEPVIIKSVMKSGFSDLSKLTRNIDETTTIVKTELEPTLKNVNKSVEIVSGMIIKTDESVQKVRNFLSKTPLKLIGQISKLSGKAAKGFLGGLCSAFKTFSKK